MRPQKVTDEKLIEGLLSVIQSKGYDGASLNELASSSGLQKASLYHRFPNGKKEITAAVLTYVEQWVDENLVNLLSNSNLTPKKRLKQVIDNIDMLYDGSEKTCVLRALTMDSNMDLFGKQVKHIMNQWIVGFTNLGISFGYSQKKAKSKALQTLVLVQGSLIVSKALSTNKPFQKSLITILNSYKKV